MAKKNILEQLNIQTLTGLTASGSGFVGFAAKSDGLYQKINTGTDLKLATTTDLNSYSVTGHTHNYLPSDGGTLYGNLIITGDLGNSVDKISNGWFNDIYVDNLSGDTGNFTAVKVGGTNVSLAGHTHSYLPTTIGVNGNLPLITTTGGVITTGSFGTTSYTFCAGDDTRLSNSRTPTAHQHGQMTNAGNIGSTANKPLITTTSGVITTGSFGTAVNTFCQGNDSRLSDARTPLAHTHNYLPLVGGILSNTLYTPSLYIGSTPSSYLEGDGIVQIEGYTNIKGWLSVMDNNGQCFQSLTPDNYQTYGGIKIGIDNYAVHQGNTGIEFCDAGGELTYMMGIGINNDDDGSENIYKLNVQGKINTTKIEVAGNIFNTGCTIINTNKNIITRSEQTAGTLSISSYNNIGYIPSIVSKSDNNSAMYFVGMTADANIAGSDVIFGVRRTDDVDFGSGYLTNKTAFSFRRYTTNILDLGRDQKATFYGAVSGASTVTATNGFYQSSKRELKENIKPFEQSALDIINKTDIVEFNYKDDLDKEYKVGFIADDTDSILSGVNKDHMDSGNSIGLLIKAMQELSNENKELRKLLECR